jgi:CubicO group peptidase (beta-lactamase class C family)
MTFVDEGKLNLEDTIGKYLPVMSQHGKGDIKIKYCLSHLTGIRSGSLKESRDLISNAKTMDVAILNIAKFPMEGVPGKTFHYSSVGLQIIAAILEKIGGKSFNTLFEERIAHPCNMGNTDFGKSPVPLAAGSGWSTAKDYLNFLTMILNNGNFMNRQVLSTQSINEMQKNHIDSNTEIIFTPDETISWSYGLGEWTMDDATFEKRSMVVSSPGLFGSFPWVDNNNHYAAFLLTLNIQNKGRRERYSELKKLIDETLSQN